MRCPASASSPENPMPSTKHTSETISVQNTSNLYEAAFAKATSAAAAESSHDYTNASLLYQQAGYMLFLAAEAENDPSQASPAKTKGEEFIERAKLLRVCGVFTK